MKLMEKDGKKVFFPDILVEGATADGFKDLSTDTGAVVPEAQEPEEKTYPIPEAQEADGTKPKKRAAARK